jgi:hypothetical protein
MSSIMDDIRAEVGGYGMRETTLDVNGKRHTLYAKPITADDRIKLDAKEFKSFTEMMVHVIITKATNKAGDPLFTVADRPVFKMLVASEIERMFVDLFGPKAFDEAEEDYEARVGNS